MHRVLRLLCVLGTLGLLESAEGGYYDYDNEVYDYYRQESSNQNNVQSEVPYTCQAEGFHEDPSDCKVFYRCVDFGTGAALTPFKFECGTGTVFSKSKGNVCVHPNDSDRPECCEPGNEIDSNEPGGGDGWNQEPQQPQQPGYPGQQTQRPPQPSYPPQTQPPRPTYPPQTQPPRPTYPPQTQRPTQTQPPRPTYPPQTQPPQTQPPRPTYPPQTQPPQTQPPRPSYPPQTQPPRPTSPSQTQRPPETTNPPQTQPPTTGGGCTPDESGHRPCGSSPGCTQEGFFPNPEDCHKFYRCVDEGSVLKRHDFTCGSGTAWDQALQTCNFENEVASCSTSGSGIGGQLPGSGSQQTERPTQPPYPPSQPTQGPTQPPYPPSRPTQGPTQTPYPPSRPTQGSTQTPYPPSRPTQGPTQTPYPPSRPTQTPYPPPQSTQSPTQTPYPTQAPTQVPSQSTKGPEYIPPNPTTASPAPGGGDGGSTQAPGTGGRPCPPAGSPKDCTSEGFFPNPNDCHKFFRCVDEGGSFRRYDFDCGTGTAWDQQLQTCNYESAVPGCGSQPPTSGSSPGGQQPGSGSGPEQPEGQQPGSTTPGTSTQQTTQSSQSTTGPGPDVTQSTSPPATSTPVQTTPQVTQPPTPQTTKQPETTVTSQPTTQQTTPQITQAPTQSPTQSSSQQPSTQQPQQTTPSTGGQSTLGPGATGSPQKPGGGACQSEGFFPNPNDCRKFYRCVSNGPGYIKYDFDCAPGTAWDQNLLTCNHIHLVESCDQGQNEIEPRPPSTSAAPPSSTQPSEENTEPSKPAQMTTTTSGESSSESTGSTESSSSTSSTSSMESSSSTSSSSTTDGSTTTSNSSSTESSSSTSSTSSTENSSTTSSGSSTESSSSEASTKPDNCNCTKPNNTIVCNEPGFYPHPTRCDKFYRCVDNGKGFNVYYFDCPPGTIFDPSIDVCNYPESVYPARDCQTGASQGGPPSSQPPSSSTQAPSSTESTTKPAASTTTPQPEGTTAGPEGTTEAPTEGSTTESTSEGTTSATTPGLETTTASPESTSEGTTPEGESTTNASTPSAETTTTSTSEPTTTEAGSTPTTMAPDSTTSPEETPSTTTGTTAETTTSPTTESESTTPSSSEKPPSVDNCPSLANLTDEQVVLVCPTGFRRHPKLCNLFYQCTMSGNMEVKILVLQCPEGTIFDEKDNKCLAESESSQPCMGSIAGKRIQRRVANNSPLLEVSTKPLCPDEGHFPYREGCSNVFYKCKRDSRYALQGYLYKCPKDFVYWSVSRRCERAARLPTCANMSNETEHENETWENRWEIPVEDRNLSARSLFL